MSDLLSLLALDQATRNQIEARNPYRAPASIFDQLGATAIQAGPDYSAGERIGAALISGLIGGTLTGFGDDYQGRAENQYLGALLGGQERDLIGPSLFNTANERRSLFQDNDALQQRAIRQELENKISLDNAQTKNDLIAKVAETDPDLARELVGLPARELEPMATSPEEGMATKLKPISERIKETATDLIRTGQATPAQAYETARVIHRADTMALQSAQKKADSVRAAASKLLEVAGTASAAVDAAGQTGGFFAPLRSLASYAYQVVSSEERQQRASDKLLDSIKPDIIKASREAGTGAMSDDEMRTYLAAGPNTGNTPEENRLLIEKYQNVGQLGLEYADYLDWYRESYGTLSGAESLWNQYKAENPILLRGEGSKVQWNGNRRPWGDFVIERMSGGGSRFAPNVTGSPTEPMAAQAAVPQYTPQQLTEMGFVKVDGGWRKPR